MARNKNSTALFDVIHSAKKPPKASPSASIPTPKWWGKDKKLPKPVASESTENAGRQQSWLSAAKKSAGTSAAQPPVPIDQPAIEPFYTEDAGDDLGITGLDKSAEIELAPPQPSVPKPRFIDRFKDRPAKRKPVAVEAFLVAAPAPDEPQFDEPQHVEIKSNKPAEHASVDRDIPMRFDAGDVRFRLSYGGVIALVFIVLIALAIAFIAGTRSSPQAMVNDSTESSSTPSTNPTSGLMAAVGPTKTADPANVHPDVLQVAPRSATIASASPSVATATPLPIKSTRDIGMIYVVVQSYAEQDLAQRACDYMNKSGIPCSLVQGPDGWAPRDWYSVVGLQPFARHDPGLSDYERAVKAAGVRFTTKIMDQFQPQGYTWRETSDLSQQ